MGDQVTNDFARRIGHEYAFGLGLAVVAATAWYVATSLAPGEEKPFKVACGGTPDRPAPESASVRSRVVEGF